MNRDRIKTIVAAAAAGIGVWTIVAVLDTMRHHQVSGRDLVAVNDPFHDFLLRMLLAGSAVVLVVRYRSVVRKRGQMHDELRNHLVAVESSMDGVAITDREGNYRYVNEAYARINGYRNPLEVLGRNYALSYGETQRSWMEQHLPASLAREGRWHGELLAERKDGTTYVQEASVTLLPDGGRVSIIRDVTERKMREKAMERSERLLTMIFDSIHDPFCIFDRDFRIVRANKAYARLKAKTVDDLIDRTCFQALEGRDAVCEGCVIKKTFQSGDPCAKEKKVKLSTGEELWLEIYTYPMLDDSGIVHQVIEYTRDVTERKKSDAEHRRLIDRLEYLSNIDGLTGLLNRRALTEQLTYEIDRARRYRSALTLILCDIDNLKEINDTYGHIAGDTAIQLVAGMLRNSLRSVDIAGRYGGDEFLVIVPETGGEGARSIAEKVLDATRRAEFRVEGDRRLTVSLSVGIASIGPPPEGIDGLIRRVDEALYASKREGKNRITMAG